jgi:hypothetical protein
VSLTWQLRRMDFPPEETTDEIVIRLDPVDDNRELLRGGKVLGTVTRMSSGLYRWDSNEIGQTGPEPSLRAFEGGGEDDRREEPPIGTSW